MQPNLENLKKERKKNLSSLLTKGKIGVANKGMKSCSTSLVIRRAQNKTM